MNNKLIHAFVITTCFFSLCAQSQEVLKPGESVQSRFQGEVSIGFHATPGYPILSPYASISFGERIKERAYIGAGLGVFLPIGPWYKNDGDVS